MLLSFKTSNLFFYVLVMLLLFFGGNFAQSQSAATANAKENEATEIWASAFGWMQTGRNLAKAKQWPLALGSFLEAQQKYQTVAKNFPSFEPEMVEYRIEALKKEMEETHENLASDDHDVMMSYLDFIDSMEKGQELRFANNLEAALPVLQIAMGLLEDVIAKRPGAFRKAVDDQFNRLAGSIEWVESQVSHKRRKLPTVTVPYNKDMGTTEFTKRSDLPGDPMISISSALFPGLVASNDKISPDLLVPAAKTPPKSVDKTKPSQKSGTELMKRLPKSLGPRKSDSVKKAEVKDKTESTG